MRGLVLLQSAAQLELSAPLKSPSSQISPDAASTLPLPQKEHSLSPNPTYTQCAVPQQSASPTQALPISFFSPSS